MDFSRLFNQFFQLIILILIFILAFSFIPKIEDDSNVEVFEFKSGNDSVIKNNLVTENETFSTINFVGLNNDEMYYCYNDNGEVIFESYLSVDNFYESFDLEDKFERIYYGGILYQSVNEDACDWIIEDYNGIYENFKLTFEKYFKDSNYSCSKINYDVNQFFKDESSLRICEDYFFIYDVEVINDES